MNTILHRAIGQCHYLTSSGETDARLDQTRQHRTRERVIQLYAYAAQRLLRESVRELATMLSDMDTVPTELAC